MESALNWLENWYKSQCDGDWEHEYGIKIYTLDNPGWAITIDLRHTELENVETEYQLIENNVDDWFSYSIKDSRFNAAGDPNKLEKIINQFKEIVKNGV